MQPAALTGIGLCSRGSGSSRSVIAALAVTSQLPTYRAHGREEYADDELLITAAALTLSCPAFAADLPSRTAKPAPIIAPASIWDGFYAGIAVGPLHTDVRYRETDPRNSSYDFTNSHANWAPAIGGFAGYNFQRGSIVYGLEADLESAKYTQEVRITIGRTWWYDRVRSDVQASLRARLGYAFGDALVYATGGVAAVHTSHQFLNSINTGFTSDPEWRIGWTLGAGAEYALTSNWRARLEYRYTRVSYSEIATSGGNAWEGLRESTRLSSQALRAGVAYKF